MDHNEIRQHKYIRLLSYIKYKLLLHLHLFLVSLQRKFPYVLSYQFIY